MRYLITIVIAALSLNAVGQTNPNYNPDYDANGSISVNDLLGFLSIFGDTWDSGDVILGCTYSNATDYNPLATMDDGSCTFLPDCAGDECGVCGGSGIADGACDCDGNVLDECGVCGGDNSTCLDCCGIPFGDGTTCDSSCGPCNDDTSCLDECGVPNGDNSTCLDECGVPNGDNSCLDDCGVPNGDNSCLDECGVPNGDNSTCFTSCGDPISHEGYDYSTVQIGDQCWFSENCRYLPEVYNNFQWSVTIPIYHVYDYDGTDVATAKSTDNYITYGVLYNLQAVMTEGICPSGWHIPSDGEWQTMEVSLGMSESEAADTGWRGTDEGYQMKSTSGWNNNGNGSNSSGFNGLPGGFHLPAAIGSNGFLGGGLSGIWWVASETDGTNNPNYMDRLLNYNYDGVYRDERNPSHTYSARCVRDYTDECGVLNGDNSCLDDCGVVNGDNSTCLDECGVVNGDNSCLDCCGIPFGDGTTCDSSCGPCNDDTSCLDECGVPNGDNSCLDDCGVPNGDNSTCTDNCGVVNGTNDCIACGDLISHEGYNYSTVQIGDQCWFSENCRYLPEVSNPSIGSITEPQYFVYGYTGTDVTAAQATSNYETDGVLYNWPAVMTEGICPSGWHIPSDEEFTELTDFLGGESIAGYAMKSTSGWINNGNGSNSSGWTGLPGGIRYSGDFLGSGENGGWWSASESASYESSSYSWTRLLYYNGGNVGPYSSNQINGFSARCVRDYTDECGVLDGDNSTCLDECGVPNGDNSTCLDECGVLNGDNSCLDDCGVPNGDNSTCLDECGVVNGDNSTCLDECGVPNGDNSTCFAGCGDGIMHDGHDYSTVQIGVQCWFSENCRYLPAVSPSNEGSDTAPYYYVYGYQGTDVTTAQATSNYSTYGVLYNWTATITEGLCPSGWHVPSDGEFTLLTDYLGGEFVAGDAMKSTSGWSENGNGSNSSGFTGLPGGNRDNDGNFFSINDEGYFYSSSAYGGSRAWSRLLNDNDSNVESINDKRRYGMSVRCLQDYTDECGVPNGDNSTCLDCCGIVNGDGSTCDGACGACGDDTSCLDECGVPNGDNSCLDDCGVPNGDNSTCADCCGVANGDGSTCDGTCGPCNDNASCLDDCDVPNGDNSTCGCDGVPNYVISHDGYNYSTVQIGDQCWFAENCRYLPNVSPSSSFSETTPYYYVYDYQGTDVAAAQATINYEIYGVLYNWQAIMTLDICPSGWHVPSDGEFTQLTDYLGGNAVAGAAMKSATAWDGTNSSGFNGLPAGNAYSGAFGFSSSNGYWWSSSASGSTDAWFRLLVNNNDGVLRSDADLSLGYSARCVRD